MNPSIRGVGWKTAELIWATFGAEIYQILDSRDVGRLSKLVSWEVASSVCAAFGLLSTEASVFEWLDRYGVSPRTAARAASVWGENTVQIIEANPYVLNLLEPWNVVDTRALRLGVLPEDPRRLMAAVEEAVAQAWARGHTCVRRQDVISRTRQLLTQAPTLADQAFLLATSAGLLIESEVSPGFWQNRASFAMERTVEAEVTKRATATVFPIPKWLIKRAIEEVETETEHKLSSRQCEAVTTALRSTISAITGGAGTGKTTILRAILRAHSMRAKLDGLGAPVWQIAVSGRAAKRMAEATGVKAVTVYSFLKQLALGKIGERHGMLVVDEASMIDLPSAYRLLTEVPEEVAICWIGDTGQLPPIGPGLFFHRLASAPMVPNVRLDRIHRQATTSSIPQVAAKIRSGCWPEIPIFDPERPTREGVWLAPCQAEDTASKTLEIWSAIAGRPPKQNDQTSIRLLHSKDAQIICPLRAGAAGAKEIGRAIEQRWMAHQKPVRNWGICVGSKLLWAKNDYDRQIGTDDLAGAPVRAVLMNGTLGVVSRCTPRGALVTWDDGQELEITEADLCKFERGWSVTIHKAQGSAWNQVIVPVTRSRLLDRTLIYTAVTRARRSVVLVGCSDVLRAAVEALPFADRRKATLNFAAPRPPKIGDAAPLLASWKLASPGDD